MSAALILKLFAVVVCFVIGWVIFEKAPIASALVRWVILAALGMLAIFLILSLVGVV